jgi:hypothetical protein
MEHPALHAINVMEQENQPQVVRVAVVQENLQK